MDHISSALDETDAQNLPNCSQILKPPHDCSQIMLSKHGLSDHSQYPMYPAIGKGMLWMAGINILNPREII